MGRDGRCLFRYSLFWNKRSLVEGRAHCSSLFDEYCGRAAGLRRSASEGRAVGTKREAISFPQHKVSFFFNHRKLEMECLSVVLINTWLYKPTDKIACNIRIKILPNPVFPNLFRLAAPYKREI